MYVCTMKKNNSSAGTRNKVGPRTESGGYAMYGSANDGMRLDGVLHQMLDLMRYESLAKHERTLCGCVQVSTYHGRV